ncbi:GatB/YqeY domain-containing protein [Magnetococcales bacterium HHB-1]
MIDLSQRVAQDLKQAMKDRDALRTRVLRMLRAAFLNEEKSAKQPTETRLIDVTRALIKQRREAAQAYKKAGQPERAEAETAEITVLETYLPQPLSDDEINHFIEETIQELNATSLRQMGAVMKSLKEKTAGRADMGQLSALVKARLSA